MAKLSIGVDLKDGVARVAVAACNTSESFSKKAANFVIGLRFDGDDQVLKSLNISRNVIDFSYGGKRPRKDILFPIADWVRTDLGYDWDIEYGWCPPSYNVNRSVNGVLRSIKDFVEEHYEHFEEIESETDEFLEGIFEEKTTAEMSQIGAGYYRNIGDCLFGVRSD